MKAIQYGVRHKESFSQSLNLPYITEDKMKMLMGTWENQETGWDAAAAEDKFWMS